MKKVISEKFGLKAERFCRHQYLPFYMCRVTVVPYSLGFTDVNVSRVPLLILSLCKVDNTTRFIEELKADSLDIYEFVMAVEMEFEIEIPEWEIVELKNGMFESRLSFQFYFNDMLTFNSIVQAVISYIERHNA